MPVSDEEIAILVTTIIDHPKTEDLGTKIADLFASLAEEHHSVEAINQRIMAPMQNGIKSFYRSAR